MKRQKTIFTLLGAVLVIIILAVGLMALHRHNQQKSDAAANVMGTVHTSTPSIQKSTQPLVAQGDTSTAAAKQVQAAYNAYLAQQQNSESAGIEAGLQVIRPYLTDALYQKLNTGYQSATANKQDEVVCAQDIPTAIVAGSSSQDAASVIVVEQFGRTISHHTVTVDSNNKISAITCSK